LVALLVNVPITAPGGAKNIVIGASCASRPSRLRNVPSLASRTFTMMISLAAAYFLIGLEVLYALWNRHLALKIGLVHETNKNQLAALHRLQTTLRTRANERGAKFLFIEVLRECLGDCAARATASTNGIGARLTPYLSTNFFSAGSVRRIETACAVSATFAIAGCKAAHASRSAGPSPSRRRGRRTCWLPQPGRSLSGLG